MQGIDVRVILYHCCLACLLFFLSVLSLPPAAASSADAESRDGQEATYGVPSMPVDVVPAASSLLERTSFEGEAWLLMDSEQPKIGEIVEWHVKTLLPEGWVLDPPDTLDLAEGLEPLREEVSIKRRLVDGKVETELTVPCILVRIGRIRIEGKQLTAKGPDGASGIVTTGRITVETGSLFANENEPAPSALMAPLPVMEKNWLLIWITAGVAVAGLAAILSLGIAAHIRRRKPKPAPPPEPAHVIALRKLDQLASRELEKVGELGLLYTELSMILREYLGLRWGFDSMDMTTTELLGMMQSRQLEGFLIEKLTYLLHDFDLVKFAKVVPAASQAVEHMDRTRNFVTATALASAQAPSSEAGEGATS